MIKRFNGLILHQIPFLATATLKSGVMLIFIYAVKVPLILSSPVLLQTHLQEAAFYRRDFVWLLGFIRTLSENLIHHS